MYTMDQITLKFAKVAITEIKKKYFQTSLLRTHPELSDPGSNFAA